MPGPDEQINVTGPCCSVRQKLHACPAASCRYAMLHCLKLAMNRCRTLVPILMPKTELECHPNCPRPCRTALRLHEVQATQDPTAFAAALGEARAQPEAARVVIEAAKPGLEPAATPCHIPMQDCGVRLGHGHNQIWLDPKCQSACLHCRRLGTLMVLPTPTLQPGRSLRQPGSSWKPPGAALSGSCTWSRSGSWWPTASRKWRLPRQRWASLSLLYR